MNVDLFFWMIGGIAMLAAFLFLILRCTRTLGVVLGALLLLVLVASFVWWGTRATFVLVTGLGEPDMAARRPAVEAPVWSPGVTAELAADVYPTAREAVEAVASRVAKSARLMSENPDGPPHLVLLCQSRPDLADDFERNLSRLMPTTQITHRRNASDAKGTNTVELTFSAAIAQASGAGRDAAAGTCEGRLRLGSTNRLHRIDCAGKPWVSNFSAFVNRRPGMSLICVRSSSACTSEEQAHAEAMQRASTQVWSLLRRGRWSPVQSHTGISHADIEQHFGILDRFTQSFDGISGKIWREALVIDVSPQKVASYQTRLRGDQRAAWGTWGCRLIGAAGVLVVIALLYLLLDTVTLGYYRPVVRTVLILLLLGAIVLLLVLV